MLIYARDNHQIIVSEPARAHVLPSKYTKISPIVFLIVREITSGLKEWKKQVMVQLQHEIICFRP